MILFVKNMVCARCIRTVSRLLSESGMEAQNVELGKVELSATPDKRQIDQLRRNLESEGFELLDDRNSRLISRIKNLIINEIHHHSDKKPEAVNFSDFLSREIGQDYSQLSKLFSSVEGRTIENFVISQRIERVKELLVYGEMSFSEIAWQTGYSSSQYLSNQFKQVTGLTPTQFKANYGRIGRQSLDML